MARAERVHGLFGSAPRYDSFYALFGRAGANLERATALLAKLVADWPDDGTRLRFGAWLRGGRLFPRRLRRGGARTALAALTTHQGAGAPWSPGPESLP